MFNSNISDSIHELDKSALINQYFRSVSSERWFYREELFLILSTTLLNTPCAFESTAVLSPQNGSFYFSSTLTGARNDNVNWGKKTSKAGDSRLRETNQKILTDEGVMIKGLYYIGEVNPNLKRRVYHLNNVYLTHYRVYEKEASQGSKRYSLSPLVQQCLLDYKTTNNNDTLKMEGKPTTNVNSATYRCFHDNFIGCDSNQSSLLNLSDHDIFGDAELTDEFMDCLLTESSVESHGQINVSDQNQSGVGVNVVFHPEPVSRSDSYSSQHSHQSHQWSGYNQPSPPYQSPQVQYHHTFQQQQQQQQTVQHQPHTLTWHQPRQALQMLNTNVVDFAPISCSVSFSQHQHQNQQQQSTSTFSEGTKMLICLSSDQLTYCTSLPIQVCFCDTNSMSSSAVLQLSAVLISPSVLRCVIPTCVPMLASSCNANSIHCRMWIRDCVGNQLTAQCDQFFEFNSSVCVPSAPPSLSASGTPVGNLGKRNLDHQRTTPVVPPLSLGSMNISYIASPQSSHNHSLPPLSIAPPQPSLHIPPRHPGFGGPLSYGSSHSSEEYSPATDERFDKENKIRIVEKLTFMKSALLHDGGGDQSHFDRDHHMAVSSTHSSSGNLAEALLAAASTDCGDLTDRTAQHTDWLDDTALSKLSHAELEGLMDRYITVVVEQMVQLAALDDDLQAEIDSLDSSGFSLLHYCCLYNLKSLIPVLRNKGADINQRTATGTSSLHLAAAAGHMAVVQLLIEECDVDVEACDAHNMLPSDAAFQAGHTNIFEYLVSLQEPSRSFHSVGRLSSLAVPDAFDRLSTPRRTLSRSSFDTSLAPTESGEGESDSSLSNKLLHEAFASLSLTDKCALSLSIGQLSGIPPSTPTTSAIGSSASNSAQKVVNSAPHSGFNSTNNTPRNNLAESTANSGYLSGSESSSSSQQLEATRVHRVGSLDDDISEMQSVLSESDKESLDVAMSMMGQGELILVEDEVRKIQNNVRGWLLRKNYTNLRDAAKVLQLAWREKKKIHPSSNTHNLLLHIHSSTRGVGSSMSINTHSSEHVCSDAQHCDTPLPRGDTPSAMFNSSYHPGNQQSEPHQQRELTAAATLQAATRRMLARRSFSSVRRQTMASLVIQKSLVKWYVLNRGVTTHIGVGQGTAVQVQSNDGGKAIESNLLEESSKLLAN